MFLTERANLGGITYLIIMGSLVVFWIILWRWHKTVKADIELNRKNLYRRWDKEDAQMNKKLKKSEQKEIEETQVVK